MMDKIVLPATAEAVKSTYIFCFLAKAYWHLAEATELDITTATIAGSDKCKNRQIHQANKGIMTNLINVDSSIRLRLCLNTEKSNCAPMANRAMGPVQFPMSAKPVWIDWGNVMLK